jgi:chromosomal replication initiator protein
VIEYLTEIPLPGRAFAPPAAQSQAAALKPASFGFIAGCENRLVAATINRLMKPATHASAAKLIAFFGRSGTGKTHLAHGLVRYWIEHHGTGTANYITAADFYRELLDAIKRHDPSEFRNRIRNYELLAIDDLHQLPAEEYVSRELRFTLDAYEENGGRVIVTSRSPANRLTNISADVCNRIGAGLLLQLSPPGKSARVRIVRRAAESLGRTVSDEDAIQLASTTRGTPNDLFGAVFQHCANDSNGSPHVQRERRPELREIITVVARYCEVAQKQMKSESRRQSIVTARAIAIYLARELNGASYHDIGRALGGRDHTTIIHSYRKIEQARARDPILQETIDELCGLLLA